MQKVRIDFYFDYLSTWAYFAHLKLRELESEGKIEIQYCPVVFGGLLNHWGQLGPVEIPPKREFFFKQIIRYARENNIPFRSVKYHPFNPLTALRLSLKEVSGSEQVKVIDCLWKFGWQKAGDLGSETEIADELGRNGFDSPSLLAKTRTEPIKELLKQRTDAAIQIGVFGVPTMVARNELFWGNDSIDLMLKFLAGQDNLDRELLSDMLNRKAGIHRRRDANTTSSNNN